MIDNYMCIDIETYDPNLQKLGPGVYRKDGCILGVAIYAPYLNKHEYINLNHKGTYASEREKNKEKIQDLLKQPCTKVAHNALYDFAWLVNNAGFEVIGRIEDTMVREPLFNAYREKYDLDSICKDYGIAGKDKRRLYFLCNQMGIKEKDAVSSLHLFEAKEIQEYPLQDALCTGQLYEAQQPKLKAEELLKINDLECRLIPLLLEMQNIGIRVDEPKRQYVAYTLQKLIDEGMDWFEEKYGLRPNLNANADILYMWDQEKLPYTLTKKGHKSFSKEIIESIDHPLCHKITEIKAHKTVLNNFVDGAFTRYQVDGRIHTLFYNMKRSDGGTLTGRFASRLPNMQQIPAKEDKSGPLIRSCFIPEEGCLLGCPDYAQIEYRLFIDVAAKKDMPGAKEAVAKMQADPTLSYHKLVQAMIGWGDERYKILKNLNFGCLYAMGPSAMSRKFYMPFEHCQELFSEYFQMIPFVRPTQNLIMQAARRYGYLITKGGRHVRLTDEMREKKQEYKLINHLIQGSASDIAKLAMVKIYEAGLTKINPLQLTVHDEFPMSIRQTKEGVEAFVEACRLMEDVMKLEVPLIVDREVGHSWGDATTEGYNDMLNKFGIVQK